MARIAASPVAFPEVHGQTQRAVRVAPDGVAEPQLAFASAEAETLGVGSVLLD
jgi:hypothetical protein